MAEIENTMHAHPVTQVPQTKFKRSARDNDQSTRHTRDENQESEHNDDDNHIDEYA